MWKLSEKALEDFDRMMEWSVFTFGRRQSEIYGQGIVKMFDTLAHNPELAPQRQSASGPVRIMPCQRHHIVYRQEGGDVAIVRILHALQNWPDLI